MCPETSSASRLKGKVEIASRGRETNVRMKLMGFGDAEDGTLN